MNNIKSRNYRITQHKTIELKLNNIKIQNFVK